MTWVTIAHDRQYAQIRGRAILASHAFEYRQWGRQRRFDDAPSMTVLAEVLSFVDSLGRLVRSDTCH